MIATPNRVDCSASLPDPRIERSRRHPLLETPVIAICAPLSGADDLVAKEQWARAREDWLRERVALPNGIPSHATSRLLIASPDPHRAVLPRIESRRPAGVRVVTGVGQVSASQGGAFQMSAAQIGALQVGPLKVGSGHYCVGQERVSRM